jgi:hypothetical protein
MEETVNTGNLDHVSSNSSNHPKCKKYYADGHLSIFLIPFKGTSNVKQYNSKKSRKWGYKICILCDVNGHVYNNAIMAVQTVAKQPKRPPSAFTSPENLKYFVKGKGVPLHAMEAHGGRGGIAPTHT